MRHLSNRETGVTLIELTVVLLILVALAGVAIPYISGTSSAALCRATDVTMQNVKKVIMERYYLDTLGHFPVSKTAGVVGSDYNLKYLFYAGGWNLFDPATQIGWRGNYLQGGITLTNGENYSATNLHNSFRDWGLAPNNHVNDNLTNGDTVILDGWGRPLILQVYPDLSGNLIARLVSAGSGNGVGLIDNNNNPLAEINTLIGQPRNSDDRILYLNAPTPAADVNPPCDEN